MISRTVWDFKAIVAAVEGQLAHDDRAIKKRLRSKIQHVTSTRARPREQAYDPAYYIALHIDSFQDSVDAIFNIYPRVLTEFGVESLSQVAEQQVRSHVDALVEELATKHEKEISALFKSWGREEPTELVIEGVQAVGASAVGKLELMIKRLTQNAAALSRQETQVLPSDGVSTPTGLQPHPAWEPQRAKAVPGMRWHHPLVVTLIGGAITILGALLVQSYVARKSDDLKARREGREKFASEVIPKIQTCLNSATGLWVLAAARDLDGPSVPNPVREKTEAAYNMACDAFSMSDVVLPSRIRVAYDERVVAEFREFRRITQGFARTASIYLILSPPLTKAKRDGVDSTYQEHAKAGESLSRELIQFHDP